MKTSIWIVFVIVAFFIGFLFGYVMSVYVAGKAPEPSAQRTGADGYAATAASDYGVPLGGRPNLTDPSLLEIPTTSL
ncbi:MAG: hypothetical protein HY644_06460 [Acidobacteria bacterium]|nr:hypothetical protein [Acidobacteriota bacterium]